MKIIIEFTEEEKSIISRCNVDPSSDIKLIISALNRRIAHCWEEGLKESINHGYYVNFNPETFTKMKMMLHSLTKCDLPYNMVSFESYGEVSQIPID